jgi:hypothetical protein
MPYVKYIFLGIIVAALAVVAPTLTLVGLHKIVEHARLARQGDTATAVVTKLEKIAGRSTRYYVDYRFKTDTGSRHAGRSDVNAATFKTLAIGRSIEVKYLSAHPSTNEAVENVTLSVAYMMLFAAAMTGLLGYAHFRTWRLLHAQIGWPIDPRWAPLFQSAR